MSENYYIYGDTLIDGSPAYASELATEFGLIEDGINTLEADIASAKSARDIELAAMASDIDGRVKASGLEADLSAEGHRLSNLADGSNPTDAANIRTVQSLIFTGGVDMSSIPITALDQGDANNGQHLAIDGAGNVVGITLSYYTQAEVDNLNQANSNRMDEIELIALAGLA